MILGLPDDRHLQIDMEEYLKERKSRFNGLKIKGRIIENQGLKTHNPGKSDKPDHTRDYGRKSQKVNERIARKLRQNERDEEVESVDTRDEYEETLELEELKERALEESSKLQIGEQAIAEKITYIENMEQEEAELLKQVQQIRLKRGKEKLKLISNGENILISFEEWRALKEQILAKAKNNNIGGLISWKEYRYNPYGNYTELDEYVIRLQNQLLHIYEYENQIQANLEQLTEERKEMLERKAQEDSKEDEMIGWKKILGNQYSLEESFDIEAVLENNSKVLSHFEQILKETVNSQKVGKGTRESVQIILDNMQNSQEERE